MKFAITFTWDSKVAAQRIKCLFRHDWERFQHNFMASETPTQKEVVIAYKICKRCAKSKLIHILE